MSEEKGFTLIELLFYLVIAISLVFVGTIFMMDIIDNKAKATAYQEVQQNARFAMEKMIQEMRSAESIGETFPVGNIAAGWIEDFGYRQLLKISESEGAGTDYPVKIMVTRTAQTADISVDSTHCLDTFEDVRFTSEDGTTLLDYWFEDEGDMKDPAIFWVKIPEDLNNSQDIFIYYGNASAESVSTEGENIFQFFDDFDIDVEVQTENPPYNQNDFFDKYGDKWELGWMSGFEGSAYQEYPSATTSNLVMAPVDSMRITAIFMKADPQLPIAIRYKAELISHNNPWNYPWNANFWFFGYDFFPFFHISQPWESQLLIGDSSAYVGTFPGLRLIGEEYTYDIMASSTSVAMAMDNEPTPAIVSEWLMSSPYPPWHLSLTTPFNNSSHIDWIYIRKYTYPEPEPTIAKEEITHDDWLSGDDKLVLNTSEGTTIFSVAEGILKINDDNLTSNQTKITNLTFTNLSRGGAEGSERSKHIKIKLTIENRNPHDLAALRAETTLETSVELDQ